MKTFEKKTIQSVFLIVIIERYSLGRPDEASDLNFYTSAHRSRNARGAIHMAV